MKFEIRSIIYKVILFPIQNLWVWVGETEWKSTEYLPYRIWKWWGNRMWFGMSFFERNESFKSVIKQLEDSFEKLKKEKPHLVKDLQIEE